MKKKVVSILLCTMMAFSLFTGCSSTKNTESDSSEDQNSVTEAAIVDEKESESVKYKDFITVDVYDGQANYQGIQSGWFAKIVKDKFNMELNIIAPNVAGGGDTLYQTRSAAGDLGDLIIMQATSNKLQDLVDSGLVVDMTDMLAGQDSLSKYKAAIDFTNTSNCSVAGTWCIPSQVSERSATTLLGGTTLNYGTYLRWDLYKEMGYPEMKSTDDLLNVLEEMQTKCPTSDSGKKTYALSLFKDWDGDFMTAAMQIAMGYNAYGIKGYTLNKADSSEDPQSLIDSNSDYIKGLKLFFDANQRGLLDPESTTQNYDTLYAKYQDGAILYSFWPWLGKTAYNTTEHLAQGKAFETAVVEGTEIYAWGCSPNGNPNNTIMIGSKAEDPERLMDFINWLYSPEGVTLSTSQTSGSCGIQGLMWDMVDGAPALTDFGLQCYKESDVAMPAEYGEGTFTDGVSQLNYQTVSAGESNPETGYPYDYTMWDSFNSLGMADIQIDWQEHMGATNAVDYFTQKDMICVEPGSGWVATPDTTDISTLRAQIKEIVKDFSWRAVFAKDENEFNSLIAEMKDTCEGLGYQDVLDFDLTNIESFKQASLAVSK